MHCHYPKNKNMLAIYSISIFLVLMQLMMVFIMLRHLIRGFSSTSRNYFSFQKTHVLIEILLFIFVFIYVIHFDSLHDITSNSISISAIFTFFLLFYFLKKFELHPKLELFSSSVVAFLFWCSFALFLYTIEELTYFWVPFYGFTCLTPLFVSIIILGELRFSSMPKNDLHFFYLPLVLAFIPFAIIVLSTYPYFLSS